MSGFVYLCRTIQDREKLAVSLASVERRLAETPWYRWKQRSDLRRRAAELSLQIADRNSKINDEEVRALANDIRWSLWDQAVSSIIPNKNSYGPAARERFDVILDVAVELGEDHVVYKDGWSFPLSRLPEVRALLTRDSMGSTARGIIDKRAAIAESTDYLHSYVEDSEGHRKLIIQHRASGLRGSFTVTSAGMGSVGSKPFEIESIDPERPGKLEVWQPYVGLGIGTGIYAEAHRLEPDVRWWTNFGTLSDYSRPLRRKLHAANPYIWAGPCEWCNVNLDKDGIYAWTLAPRSWFNAHP
jgi:hypothetical protein